MQLGSVGRAVLHRAHPFAELQIVVDGRQWRPVGTTVLGPKQALRRGAGIPAARLAGMPRGQPKCVVHRPARRATCRVGEGRWLLRLFPAAAQVGGTEDGRAQVAGLGRSQERAAIARVELKVTDRVAQKVRAIGHPGFSPAVAVKNPGAFARGHQDEQTGGQRRCTACCGLAGGGGGGGSCAHVGFPAKVDQRSLRGQRRASATSTACRLPPAMRPERAAAMLHAAAAKFKRRSRKARQRAPA
jgi:hypothetical protein